MTLELTVPEPISGSAISVETNPKAVKAWLVSLPPANVLETARAIYDALTTLNRIKLDQDARFKLVEHYQVAIDLLDAPLEGTYASAAAPAKEKARQAAALARNLRLELLNAYKLILRDRLSARFSLGNKQIPELILSLFTNHNKLLWVCARSYLPVPPGVWYEIHALFRYVIQHKLIDLPESADHPIKTIGGMYKQMLLLALVDPYRFHPLEHEKIQDLIKSYGAMASFQPMSTTPSPAGCFLIRLESDMAPEFVGQRPLEVDRSNAILLDTVEMARQLHKAMASVEQKLPTVNDRAKAQTWIDLLRRVSRQWSIPPKRTFPRIRANAKVEMTGGMRMTAFYLNGSQPLLQPVVLGDEIEITESGPQSVAGTVYGAPDAWMVINESPGGYALRLQPLPQHGGYRVGDIVGLRAHPGEAWLVGCIRWLQAMEDADTVEVGVQILAPGGEPGMLRPTIAHAGATFQPCLILPEVAPLKQPPLIVAARGSFGPMRELLIYTESGERTVRAMRLHEQAVGFESFEFVS
ncbi:hypothetical protein [Chitinimonas sp. BJYL2]|uniref:hypothetical protein n=1 Tax=Chitinimonas sp. BJYL2 TaxID=2976696 RepID=UPI0022B3D9FD|nr:hypothetical protein [Chitinimonas sp. BJYL2]